MKSHKAVLPIVLWWDCTFKTTNNQEKFNVGQLTQGGAIRAWNLPNIHYVCLYIYIYIYVCLYIYIHTLYLIPEGWKDGVGDNLNNMARWKTIPKIVLRCKSDHQMELKKLRGNNFGASVSLNTYSHVRMLYCIGYFMRTNNNVFFSLYF